MKHIFIFDTESFHEDEWRMDAIFDSIEQYFRDQGKTNFCIKISRFRRDAIVLIEEQVKENEGDTVRVYAVGGDGILFDCLNGIAGLPNIELAVVPHGDSISFLRIFGKGKAELFKDIESLINAPAIPTDIIYTGNNYVLNAGYIGLTPAITVKMKGVTNKLLAFLNYLSIVYDKQIIAQQYQITIDDQDYSGKYSLIKIANGPYYSDDKFAAAGAIPDDGWLDVILFKSFNPLTNLLSMRMHAKGKKPFNCIILRAKKIAVSSNEPMWIQLDSEFFNDTSFTFEVIPGAVQFVTVNNLTYQTPQ